MLRDGTCSVAISSSFRSISYHRSCHSDCKSRPCGLVFCSVVCNRIDCASTQGVGSPWIAILFFSLPRDVADPASISFVLHFSLSMYSLAWFPWCILLHAVMELCHFLSQRFVCICVSVTEALIWFSSSFYSKYCLGATWCARAVGVSQASRTCCSESAVNVDQSYPRVHRLPESRSFSRVTTHLLFDVLLLNTAKSLGYQTSLGSLVLSSKGFLFLSVVLMGACCTLRVARTCGVIRYYLRLSSWCWFIILLTSRLRLGLDLSSQPRWLHSRKLTWLHQVLMLRLIYLLCISRAVPV